MINLKKEHDKLYHSELSPICFNYNQNFECQPLKLNSDYTIEVFITILSKLVNIF